MNSSSSKRVIVSEEYVSFQGTGLLAGVRQYFVRLAGCSVKCPLRDNCDQPESLGGSGRDVDIREIVRNAEVSGTCWLHITGGEPLEQKSCEALINLSLKSGLNVQLQTSGGISFYSEHVHVSVSPKNRHLKVPSPDEVILVAAKWMTDGFALDVAETYKESPIYVIPEATNGVFECDMAIGLVDVLHRNGYINARLGLQSHLVWNIK